MITISENATQMTTMEMDPWCNSGEVRVSGFLFLNTSGLWHQHDQCEGQSISKRTIFKLILNVLTHPFGNKYSLKLIPNSQNILNSLKSYPEHNKQ